MIYPYYRVTRYTYNKTKTVSWDIQSWFNYLSSLGDKVALVNHLTRGWSVWKIGEEQGHTANDEELIGEVCKVSSSIFLYDDKMKLIPRGELLSHKINRPLTLKEFHLQARKAFQIEGEQDEG